MHAARGQQDESLPLSILQRCCVRMGAWEFWSGLIIGAREGFIWVAAHIVSWLALSTSPASFRRTQAIGVVERCVLNTFVTSVTLLLCTPTRAACMLNTTAALRRGRSCSQSTVWWCGSASLSQGDAWGGGGSMPQCSQNGLIVVLGLCLLGLAA